MTLNKNIFTSKFLIKPLMERCHSFIYSRLVKSRRRSLCIDASHPQRARRSYSLSSPSQQRLQPEIHVRPEERNLPKFEGLSQSIVARTLIPKPCIPRPSNSIHFRFRKYSMYIHTWPPFNSATLPTTSTSFPICRCESGFRSNVTSP